MSPIVEAQALSRVYQVSAGAFRAPNEVKALTRTSFSLQPGKTLAVVGESGCGKSTLARLITMIEQPSDGDLRIGGIDAKTASKSQRADLRRMVQMVFQNPYGSLNPRQKIGAALEEPLVINTRLSASERRTRARAMLDRIGLRPEHYERYPHMFSGGQRQRIAIGRALMLDPRIVVLDEPVSALDVSIQAQILNLLADLQESLGLTYLFISHDLSVVRHFADQVMVMYLGRPVEMASVADLFANPRHPYTKALLSATPIADPKLKRERIRLGGELPSPINPPSGCAFNPRCPHAFDRCRVEIPDLETHEATQVACHAVSEGKI